jgi:ribosomal protein L32E
MVANRGFHGKQFKGLSGGDFTGGGGENSEWSRLNNRWLSLSIAERERIQEKVNNELHRHDKKYRTEIRQEWARSKSTNPDKKRRLNEVPEVPSEGFKFKVLEPNRKAVVVYSEQELPTNVFVSKHPSGYYRVSLSTDLANKKRRVFIDRDEAQRYAFYLAYKEIQESI